ncbi:hypothetical protein PBY51_022997 [Eleginops maclovinus]|uniref:Uncharacterized protein n=1 Tax=Eleginops maclovinus TaxID=56733 RepID=A0AAN7XJ16_ELEMC|nr:hypothetical protein PBY51_022997 [Eleginops maclovinus]
MLQPMPPAEPSADGSSSDYSPCPSEPGGYPPVYIPVYGTSLLNRGRQLAVPQPGPTVRPPSWDTPAGSGRAACTASTPALAPEEPPVVPDDQRRRLDPGEREREMR